MHLICVSKVLEELKCLFKYSFLSFFVILLDSWHLYWFHYSWSSLWQWQEFCRLFCPSKLLQFLIPNRIVQIWYYQNRRLWTVQRKQRSLHWTFSIHTVFSTIHSLFLGTSMIAINTFSISSITWSSPMPNKTVSFLFSPYSRLYIHCQWQNSEWTLNWNDAKNKHEQRILDPLLSRRICQWKLLWTQSRLSSSRSQSERSPLLYALRSYSNNT